MQFKNSMLLLTALSAGSAVARLHGHQRRHAHPKHEIEVEAEPATPLGTTLPKVEGEVEPRAVGDVVSCTIDGILQTWINEWSGEASTTASASSATDAPATTSTSTPIVTQTPTQEATGSPSVVESSIKPVPTTGGGGDWTTYPKDGNFCKDGFGGNTYKDVADEALGVLWTGNIGSPWGSNIIEVKESEANKYQFVFRIEGDDEEEMTVIFWNKKGPKGDMTGFFSPNKALSFTLSPNEAKYVAIDSESTGGLTAFHGSDSPLSEYGGYASTWGEFTVRNLPNFSAWDVSCIQAEDAKKTIQGMKMCEHHHGQCSSITKGMGKVTNAYTSAETHINGIGGNIKSEAVRLLIKLNYAE